MELARVQYCVAFGFAEHQEIYTFGFRLILTLQRNCDVNVLFNHPELMLLVTIPEKNLLL